MGGLSANRHPSSLTERTYRGCTPRSFAVGAISCALMGIFGPMNMMKVKASGMSWDFSTPMAVFLFFILVFVINGSLKFIEIRIRGDNRYRLNLDTGELLVVYLMMTVACSLITMGLVVQLLPFLTAAHFFDSPVTEYEKYIIENVPSWMIVSDPVAAEQFFIGMREPAPDFYTRFVHQVPWNAWVVPLLAWTPLLLGLYMVMISLTVIFRRQWVEHERLVFPLAQVPLDMAEEGASPEAARPFFKDPVMWLGFSIPTIIFGIKGLGAYIDNWPDIPLQYTFSVFRETVPINLYLSFPWIGFTYLLNTDVALSLWVFALLAKFETGLFNILGAPISEERLGLYGVEDHAVIYQQGMGALIVYVVAAFWTARKHLRGVFRKALLNDSSINDDDEILSYRQAVFGAVLGFLVMLVWLNVAGLKFWIALVFLLLAFMIFFAITRFIAQGGMPSAVAPAIAAPMTFSLVGTSAIGPAGLAVLSYTYIWAGDLRTFVMAAAANGVKFTERVRRKRAIFWAMALAIFVTLSVSIPTTIYLAYRLGGQQAQSWFFGRAQNYTFTLYADKARELERKQETLRSGDDEAAQAVQSDEAGYDSTEPYWKGYLYKGIGGGVMALLIYCRHVFYWWPIHPLGFLVGVTWIVQYSWASIALAWLIKTLILRLGGPTVFRRLRPFFLGLIVGQFVIIGVFFFANWIFDKPNFRIMLR